VKIVLITLLFILTSCGGQELSDSALKRRSLKEYYVSSGEVNYFLPELPSWANYSSSGQCYLDKSVRYLNFEKLRRSLLLSYEEAVQMQMMFNYVLQKAGEKEHIETVDFKSEEKIFYDVTQKIQQKIRSFNTPKYSRLHVIWIDPFLGEKGALKKILSSKEMSLGHPILLSMCLSLRGLENYLRSNKMNNKNIRLISSEAFTPYDKNNEVNYQFNVNLDDLFKIKKKVYLYLKKGKSVPKEIKGHFYNKKI
jgi:hypothetical protein